MTPAIFSQEFLKNIKKRWFMPTQEKTKMNNNCYLNNQDLLLKLIAILLIGMPLLFIIFTPFGIYENYSNGERSGIIQKITQKGLIFKSTEVEMVLQNNGFNQQSDLFYASSELDLTNCNCVGKKVKITYSQYWKKPITIDSQYKIKKIELIK